MATSKKKKEEATMDYYDGPVCYVDGWHYTVVPHPDGLGNGDEGHVYEVPGERLHFEDSADGSKHRYRLATEEDTRSLHERKHQNFAMIELDDGAASERVSPDEFEAIQQMLRDRRGQ